MITSETTRTIDGVLLVEKRGDGTQLYEWGDGPDERMWLCGWNAAHNVKVGDTGRLEYRVSSRSGLYWFVKEEEGDTE